MKHHQDKKTAMKKGYTARNNHHDIVKNLSQFMLWSCFLIATDGDFTTSSDRLFQASTTLLLKKYFLTSVEQNCLDINWDEAMKLCRTIDDMWEYFKQKLLTGMTKFNPRSKHFSKNSKKNFQPFNLE